MLLSPLPRSLHAFPACRVLRLSDEALRVAGLIGRTRGSIARLHDRQ